MDVCLATLFSFSDSIFHLITRKNYIMRFPCGKRLVVFPGNCEWDLSKDQKNSQRDHENNPKCWRGNVLQLLSSQTVNAEMKLFPTMQGPGHQGITLNCSTDSEIYPKERISAFQLCVSQLDLNRWASKQPRLFRKTRQCYWFFKVINQFAITWEPLCPEIFQERQVC